MKEILFCKYFVMDFSEGWLYLVTLPMAPIKAEVLEAHPGSVQTVPLRNPTSRCTDIACAIA